MQIVRWFSISIILFGLALELQGLPAIRENLHNGPAFVSFVRVSGTVTDSLSREVLIGATLYDSCARVGTVTDANGYFSMTLSVPSTLKISYTGYSPRVLFLDIPRDTVLHFSLSPGLALTPVKIQGFSPPVNFNITTLTTRELDLIPSITGKPDIMKALQLMPGIQAMGEGMSMILVRGGSPGENQYLLDGIPLTYVNHLGGFFSVFNPDVIQSLIAYKGGFSPRFGGKLSSVIDITQKQGDHSSVQGNLSVGITDLSFAAEGPMGKNGSFMVSGRKSFVDLYFAIVSSQSNENASVMIYGLHDINTKFTWKPDTKNSFFLSLYYGDDYLYNWGKEKNGSAKNREKTKVGHIWGNCLASVHWTRNMSPRLFFDHSLSFTRYRIRDISSVKFGDPQQSYKNNETVSRSATQFINLYSDWKYYIFSVWQMKFGLRMAYSVNTPNTLISSSAAKIYRNFIHAWDMVLYVDNTLPVSSWFSADIGFRMGNYISGSYVKFSPEPRVRLDFKVGENHTLNMGYTRMSQNEQLFIVPGPILNNEIWISSTKNIPTSYSNQFSASWKGFFKQRMFEAEISVYYKNLQNLSDLKEGCFSLGGDQWESKIVSGGSGVAYGVETQLKKSKGAFTGFLSYTYARSFRKYADINEGKPYVYAYDRPHTATLGLNWQINSRWSVSLTWIYQTGLPYTPAIGKILIPSLEPNENKYYEACVFGEKNSSRMKDYHRLDIGARYEFTTKRGRRACWTFSIYNAYCRFNPLYYYYDAKGNKNLPSLIKPFDSENPAVNSLALYQYSLFPLIPMVSYKIYFDGQYLKEKRRKKSGVYE